MAPIDDAKAWLDKQGGDADDGYLTPLRIQSSYTDLEMGWKAYTDAITPDQGVSSTDSPSFAAVSATSGVVNLRYSSGSLRQVTLGGTIIKRQQTDGAYSVFEVINGADTALVEVMADGAVLMPLDERWRKWTGTQTEYDALGSYDADTLYVVT